MKGSGDCQDLVTLKHEEFGKPVSSQSDKSKAVKSKRSAGRNNVRKIAYARACMYDGKEGNQLPMVSGRASSTERYMAVLIQDDLVN